MLFTNHIVFDRNSHEHPRVPLRYAETRVLHDRLFHQQARTPGSVSRQIASILPQPEDKKCLFSDRVPPPSLLDMSSVHLVQEVHILRTCVPRPPYRARSASL
jgi:hypothetical protein